MRAAFPRRLAATRGSGRRPGDLHVVAERAPLRELAEAARARGYEYVAVPARWRPKTRLDEIERLNEELDGLVLLKSAEVEILEDGSLGLPDALLERLDLTICALHRRLDLPRRRQTERVLRAMASPYFGILAHPAGRLIGVPEPAYDVDLERVLEGAAERGCFVELNAQPTRLDLDDVHCKLAKELGVKVAISTAAATPAELDFMRFGIGQARRGWLEPRDALNTRPLGDVRALLAQLRA